jgi:hypothetical protein
MDDSMKRSTTECREFPISCKWSHDAGSSATETTELWILFDEHCVHVRHTFYDRRNGVEFGVTPNGGRYEGQITNEQQYKATGIQTSGTAEWMPRRMNCRSL